MTIIFSDECQSLGLVHSQTQLSSQLELTVGDMKSRRGKTKISVGSLSSTQCELNCSSHMVIQMIRDPKKQIEMVGVPEDHLSGHAFHMYHLTSPDKTVSFEFQHNVCGRSIYAEGTVDATIFLAHKVRSKAEKRIYDMIDVLREGNMR